MKEVTREVIKDLLPLYAAGEASKDSQALVEEWLCTDPELASLVAELQGGGAAPAKAPAGAGRKELAAARTLLRRRSWLMALAILFTVFPLSFWFDERGLRLFMLRDAPGTSAVSWAIAIGLWAGFGAVSRRLSVTGL
jgi:anti-sigma factor RsiW